jgi:site-specific DNA recombinase
MIALYARVSTDMQETGLASQVAAVRRLASEKYSGGKFSDEEVIDFQDDGYTGDNLERPKLDELRDLVRAGRVSVVLAYDPDRLSRRLGELIFLLDEFEKAGVALDFVTGSFEQTDSGRLLMHMRGAIAQYERAQIRNRTQRGRLEAARNGRIAGGRQAFGYEQKDGILTINEPQAASVRRIFGMALAGQSMRSIVKQLNAEGVLPQRGHEWQKSSLARILTRETYVGQA